MTTSRRKYSQAEELFLLSQVDSACPVCGNPLFYKKKKNTYKCYELAHIYPLNPTVAEIEELKEEKHLCEDVNHTDNIIPLCVECHTKFDKPRTALEYRELAAHKLAAIRHTEQQAIQAGYQIEIDILKVIDGLYSDEAMSTDTELEYDPKSIDQKLDSSMPLPTLRKIKHNVSDYYQYIKDKFLEIENESPNSSELIYAQVRTFYVKQKTLGLSQQEIFLNIVNWVQFKTNPRTPEAAEIVASFFVQNCEVFE